jgi:dolichyl-phosphate-mannose-protein mannosyltransferase
VHEPTGRNLHSHNVPAPVTKLNNEISCYGNATIGDINDYWVVEVVDDIHRGKREKVDRIHSLTTRLRLRHFVSGCYVRAANKNLPEWGFKQIEVSCDKENNQDDPYTYWNVESHWNDRCAPLFVLPSEMGQNGDVLTRVCMLSTQCLPVKPSSTARRSFVTFGT